MSECSCRDFEHCDVHDEQGRLREPAKSAAVADVRKLLASAASDELRLTILSAVAEGWCTLCGAKAPCYCAPQYDA